MNKHSNARSAHYNLNIYAQTFCMRKYIGLQHKKLPCRHIEFQSLQVKFVREVVGVGVFAMYRTID